MKTPTGRLSNKQPSMEYEYESLGRRMRDTAASLTTSSKKCIDCGHPAHGFQCLHRPTSDEDQEFDTCQCITNTITSIPF